MDLLIGVSRVCQWDGTATTTTTSSSATATATTVCSSDHIETTYAGHAFCLLCVPPDQVESIKERSKTLLPTNPSWMIGGYRPHLRPAMPETVTADRSETNPHDEESPEVVHLVTIQKRDTMDDDVLCCPPPFGIGGSMLRGKKRKALATMHDTTRGRHQESSADDYEDMDPEDWILHVQSATFDPTPIDTTKKVYERKIIGGWICQVEPNWHGGDEDLEQRLANDLAFAAKVLPPHASEYLRAHCKIWINRSISWGPVVCPIKGRGCCYHPDVEWLRENGLHVEKAKCIEINDGPGYKDDAHLWGPGGVMVHELSHAYHDRMLPDGYDNPDILACYRAAMKDKLYDCVKVHGTQGPTAKAYACTNDKEYFAELSTAFLGGVGEYTDHEYNKWFPFNRKQVKEHDPRAHALLSRLWRIDGS